MSAPEFGAIQSSSQRLSVLWRLIEQLAKEGRTRVRVLEVGSYEGSSALEISRAIAKHCPMGGSVLCIDPWENYLPEEQTASSEVGQRMHRDFLSGDVFRRFQHNIKFAESAAPISFIKASFKDVAAAQIACSFDLVYIDGDHRYAAVWNDLWNAKRLVSHEGFLCGDDLEHQIESPAAREKAEQLKDLDYVSGYHPGVSLAVHEVFGPVWCERGVWAVRKEIDGTWSGRIL